MPTGTGSDLKLRAEELLQRSIGPDAEFRPQQWEAINRLVADNQRLLLVQRTGWGKSTVYFIATKLLREQGAGPTLIVSPLLSLMRNQIQDAETQLGLDAWTINSNNTEEWDKAREAVVNGQCDILLISPERLANTEFRENILLEMDDEFGLLVVDEAHCISDWGHDFRPDYRRIRRILQNFPDHIPVAATTATANDRVVDDITDQVPNLHTIRGELVRDSLRIQTIELNSRAERMAWVAENIGGFDHSGIIYCLTTDEVETVAEWLQNSGHNVEPYHGGMDGDRRQALETQLMNNDIDALVATNALGMGFNKPDLGWVIHYQRPPNLIRYYQEIGRAGRGLNESYAVLLSGDEDDDIAEYFIENAFPDPEDFHAVLTTLDNSDEQLYKYELLKRVNVAWKAATTCLNILRVENAIIKRENGFERTSKDWSYDHDRIESVTQHRWDELERIQEFVTTDECLTRFIDDELDGALDTNCGQCANCAKDFVPRSVQNQSLVDDAVHHYRAETSSEISARYYMPNENGRSKIAENRKPEDGRVLCTYGDPGWGERVKEQRGSNQYDDDLVTAAVDNIETWDPTPAPEWVTAIPTRENSDQISALADRIAEQLGLPYLNILEQPEEIQPQHELANSYQKRWNIDGSIETNGPVMSKPVLLIDDIVNSRWTLTEASIVLRDNGSGAVHPFALAEVKMTL